MGEKRTFVIGRACRADIPLADASVSNRHAELTFLPGGKVLLTDCKSTNGTYRVAANGRAVRIHRELIAATDTLRFGRFTIPARELFEALRMRAPRAVAGERLVRGACGHVKPADGPCPECGR